MITNSKIDKITKPGHYFNAPRSEMLKYVPDRIENALEVGCGEGYFGAAVKKRAQDFGSEVKVTGIEIDEKRAEKASLKLDEIIVKDIELIKFNEAAKLYDCIIFNDVLEHLKEPWVVLENIKNILHPDGCVVASIPNILHWGVIKDLLYDADWRYADEGILDVTHLRFFTRKSINRLFEEQGYEIITIEGINSRVRGWKFKLLNLMTNSKFSDIQFLQFAIVAKKRTVPVQVN